MSTTSMAAVLYAEREPLVLEQLDVADPGPDEVQIAVAASGICASDVHLADGTLDIPGLPAYPLPVVPGHEAAGIVERVGSAVRRVQPGDYVIVNIYPGCGYCDDCICGRASHCSQMRPGELPSGGSRLSSRGRPIHQMSNCSSFSERTVVPARGCIKIPNRMPLDRACLIGCGVATAYGAVFRNAAVQPGHSVLVVGVGGVGLNVVQAAVVAGATTIIAVDLGQGRLDQAAEFGATHTIDAADPDWPSRVADLTAGGVDRGFEVVSTPGTVRQAYEATRDGGLLTVVGLAPPGSTVTLPTVPSKGFARGGLRWTQPVVDYSVLVQLYLEGRLKLDELISHERPLMEVNDVLDEIRRGEHRGRVILTNRAVLDGAHH
ncbi:alcohol dehydrogenase catalytic domain-containing protein [Rhodococcus koreensis]|uniref:alcohol dehydrogenase catalytic domain-containing protein n=1 Tax=Rhodococcus koreensis TaxID=99653 RepID=UPI0036D89F12